MVLQAVSLPAKTNNAIPLSLLLHSEQEAGKYKALLFTDKPKTPLMWRGVSVDLKGKMTLGV